MAYYVYKITNKINGKWYIGERKHISPPNDSYMGSGKLIKLAISKYGLDNFTKEIINIFDTNNDAAMLESMLVTKENVANGQSYNMHEGGHGGFAHLNNGSLEHSERSKRGALKSSGNKHPNWGIHRFQKGQLGNKELSLKANQIKKQKMKDNPEKYIKTYQKISDYQKNNNSMKNRCWCVPINCIDYMKEKKTYLKNNIPNGWVTIGYHKNLKKRKSGVFGKFWIHNPSTKQNKYCSGEIPIGWYKGRKQEYYQRNVG
jgi:hypothetical protein